MARLAMTVAMMLDASWKPLGSRSDDEATATTARTVSVAIRHLPFMLRSPGWEARESLIFRWFRGGVGLVSGWPG